LAAGSQDIDVIVDATAPEVDALAAKYNVKIKKRLASGAVLHVTAGQLDALRADDGVGHLSGDIRIQPLGDVTAQAIGADQVWAGAGSLPPLSGRRIGVAVIDSGI